MRISPLILQSPTRLSITGFAILILFGTVLLMLPSASTTESLGFVNALFTATSATCVTGLVVMDTGKGLTTFGQLTILGLIQVGGLGIMTLSIVAPIFFATQLRAQSHGGDVVLKVIEGRIVTGLESAGFSESRVFAGELGEIVPNEVDEPGFGSEMGRGL